MRLFLLVSGALMAYLALTYLAVPKDLDLVGRIGLVVVCTLFGELSASLHSLSAAPATNAK